MKQYPSIPKERPSGQNYFYFFDKLDGSNLRAEWSKKEGFYKFGSKTQLIDESSPILGQAIPLIKNLENTFSEKFKKLQAQRGVAFFEFLGPNSFAGTHLMEDPKSVYLIDVSVHPKGFLFPKDYLKFADGLPHAPLLYQGPMDQEFIEQVKKGTMPGMSLEGVIGKSSEGRPGLPNMFKIKNEAWLQKLRNYCGNNEELFIKLS